LPGFLGAFAYGTMVLVLFPLSFLAVEAGGGRAVGFVLGVMLLHVVLDNCFAPIARSAKDTRGIHDLWLKLQLPCALVLLGLVVLKSATPAALARIGLAGITPYGTWSELAGGIFATAFMYGGNTVVAHEFMHRRDRAANALAWVLLTVTGDAQFVIAHVHGHHLNVGTGADAATARRGESVYRFFVRSTIGQYAESFALEAQRIRDARRGVRLLKNRVVRGIVASAVLIVLSGLAFGVRAGVAVFGVMVVAKLLLEAINYIQHYGLVRVHGERVLPRHSWDCVGRGAGYILFGLGLHADHHANPTKPMWQLAPSSGSPLLKHGYMATLIVAFFPPLWFRYIGTQLREWDDTMASPLERRLLAGSSLQERAA